MKIRKPAQAEFDFGSAETKKLYAQCICCDGEFYGAMWELRCNGWTDFQEPFEAQYIDLNGICSDCNRLGRKPLENRVHVNGRRGEKQMRLL